MTVLDLKTKNIPAVPELFIPPGSRGADQVFVDAMKKYSTEMAIFLNQYLKEHADDIREIGTTDFNLV